MADKFYPSLSSVVSVDNLPEQIGFFQGVFSTIFDKLYFRDLQVVKSNRDPTKYPIRTIRIPLTEFVNQGINHAAINRVLFKFPNVAGGGKVTIDNVLFVK